MTKPLSVACLYSASGLAAIADRQNLTLSTDANRTLMSIVLSKIGPTLGQKIFKNFVQKCEDGWGNEQFEVEAILEYSKTEEGEFYLIKWQNWPHYFNTWEPKSNLDCPELLAEFHDSLNSGRHITSSAGISESESKKRKIEELIRQLLHYDSQMTAISLFQALKQVEKTEKLCIHSPQGPYASRKRKFATLSISNKRSKAYRLHSEEVRRALKDWEKHLNSISTDPAPITIENNVDLEGPPQNFYYINDYMPGQGVSWNVNPVCGCECTDCFKQKKTCCGCNAGSDFAYYVKKRVRLPPGYPIYECNKQCHCGPDCPNRVVQNGRKHRVCIFRTNNGRGWGVKALQKIKKGSFVMEYVGEVITNEEAERRGKNYDANGMTYLFDLDYQDPDCPYTVDAGIYGNVSHFVNHSCDPNLTVYGVWINNLDPRLPRIALFASKDINKGEELTFDYMMTGDTTVPAEDLKSQVPESLDAETSAPSHNDEAVEVLAEDIKSRVPESFAAQTSAPSSNDEAVKVVMSTVPVVPNSGVDMDIPVEPIGAEDLDTYTLDKANEANNNLLPTLRIPSAEEPIKEIDNSAALRKQKNRIMCQCGSAKCRKYLF